MNVMYEDDDDHDDDDEKTFFSVENLFDEMKNKANRIQFMSINLVICLVYSPYTYIHLYGSNLLRRILAYSMYVCMYIIIMFVYTRRLMEEKKRERETKFVDVDNVFIMRIANACTYVLHTIQFTLLLL